MEAAFVNLVSPGDPVVVGVNGLFGERMCEVAGRVGAEVVRVEAPWGQPLDARALLGPTPHPAVIAVVHAETSTGVRNDVAARRAGQGRRPLARRRRDVPRRHRGGDRRVVGRRRLQLHPEVPRGPAGSRRPSPCPSAPAPAWSSGPPAGISTCPSCPRYVEGEGGARVYHHTAPVTMIGALHAGARRRPGRGPGGVLGPPRGVRGAPPARARGHGPHPVRGRGRPPAPAHHGARARPPAGRDDRAGVPPPPPRPLRHRDRGRRRRAGRHGVADRLHGPRRGASSTSTRSSPCCAEELGR